MYICEKCKKKYRTLKNKEHKIFPLVKVLTFESEEETICKCGGNIVELKKCQKCGAEMISEYDLCAKCFSEYKTFDTALGIGEDCQESISINGFLLSCFSKIDIELILIDALKNIDKPTLAKSILEYCNENEEYFKEYAEKLWKNSKK